LSRFRRRPPARSPRLRREARGPGGGGSIPLRGCVADRTHGPRARPCVYPSMLSRDRGSYRQDPIALHLRTVPLLKHRTILLTLYAAGLRLSEASHLRLADIHGPRMQIHITNGKGRKERLVPISPRLLHELREYWEADRPSHYLFPGKTEDVPLSSATVQKACKLAAATAGIHKPVTPHTLRHSYATGLLEAGVDLLTISRLLGHSSFITTMVYLHVRRPHLDSTPSPLDWLPVRQCPRWLDSNQAPLPNPPGDSEPPTNAKPKPTDPPESSPAPASA